MPTSLPVGPSNVLKLMRRLWGLTFELPVVLPQIALIWLALVLIVQAILASSGPGNSKDEFVRASVSANQRLSAYCYPQWIEEYLEFSAGLGGSCGLFAVTIQYLRYATH